MAEDLQKMSVENLVRMAYEHTINDPEETERAGEDVDFDKVYQNIMKEVQNNRDKGTEETKSTKSSEIGQQEITKEQKEKFEEHNIDVGGFGYDQLMVFEDLIDIGVPEDALSEITEDKDISPEQAERMGMLAITEMEMTDKAQDTEQELESEQKYDDYEFSY